MNISRKFLRIWLTISSLLGFVAGWIFLSHTAESKTTIQVGNITVEMPDIQAIPTVNGSGPNSVQAFSLNPNTSQLAFSPSFRTGGS